MSKSYSVTLPVKPYVKKFIETLEGAPIIYNGDSMTCMLLRAYLQNKNYTGLSAERKALALSLRKSSIQILVPVARQYSIGTTLSADSILQINKYLEDIFERALFQFMRGYVKKEGRYKGYKEGIEAFCQLYNIQLEEDITFDGLKKMEYRFRKTFGEKLAFFISPFVPSM